MASLQSSKLSLDDDIVLVSEDNQKFTVKLRIVKMFNMLNNMLENSEYSEPVPLMKISGRAFEKMLEFAEMHQHDPPVPEEQAARERRRTSYIKDIDQTFVDGLDQSLLCELIYTSNFLDFPILFDTLCKAAANMIKNKTVDEIRSTFGIVNDYSSYEESQLKQENSWIEKQ